MSFVDTFSHCCLLFSFEVALFFSPVSRVVENYKLRNPISCSLDNHPLIAHHFCCLFWRCVCPTLPYSAFGAVFVCPTSRIILLSSHFPNDFILVNKTISFCLFTIFISVCFLVFLVLILVSRLKKFLPIFLFCFVFGSSLNSLRFAAAVESIT
jgi:hypothetical protein